MELDKVSKMLIWALKFPIYYILDIIRTFLKNQKQTLKPPAKTSENLMSRFRETLKYVHFGSKNVRFIVFNNKNKNLSKKPKTVTLKHYLMPVIR